MSATSSPAYTPLMDEGAEMADPFSPPKGGELFFPLFLPPFFELDSQ